MTMNKQTLKIFLSLWVLFASFALHGQNYNSNNNQNTVIINNTPVVERTKVVETVKTVVVEKPAPKPTRYARKLSSPVCILNSLWVYTEDLGVQSKYGAQECVDMLNNTAAWGRNDWRVPTQAELSLMMQYANEVGLGDETYLYQYSGESGILRPVSTGLSIKQKQAKELEEQRASEQELKNREREEKEREQELEREKQRQLEKERQAQLEKERQAQAARQRALEALH